MKNKKIKLVLMGILFVLRGLIFGCGHDVQDQEFVNNTNEESVIKEKESHPRCISKTKIIRGRRRGKRRLTFVVRICSHIDEDEI